MNIAKLISPIILHNRPVQSKKQAIDLQETQQTHTPISIPNQLPHCQRSYFKQSHFAQSQINPKNIQEALSKEKPKLKKIESELSQIDKLKNQYAKRLKTQTYSQEKICNRSNQRHLLKPSAAPKIGVVTSEFSISSLNQRQNKNIKQQTFSFQIQAKSPKDESNDDLYNNNQQNQTDLKKDIGLRTITNNMKCNCQAEFGFFMEIMKEKMQNIVDRVKLIEQNNAKFASKFKKTTINHQIKLNKNSNFQKQNVRKERKARAQSISEASYSKSNQKQSQRVFSSVSNIDQNDENKKAKTLNEGSRAKVEALLQRLHLRIQKQ